MMNDQIFALLFTSVLHEVVLFIQNKYSIPVEERDFVHTFMYDE